MRRPLSIALASLFVAALVAPTAQAAAAQAGKKNPKLKVVKAFGSAGATGAIATATATCPKTERPDLGPWRAISGSFQMMGVVPGYTMNGPPPPPSGSGVVYESRKLGQRSWRASAQSVWGTFTLELSLYCQNSVPKTKQSTAWTAASVVPAVGPAVLARCSSGKVVSGGFSTAPPLTATGAANTVIASMPSGKNAWETQALSSQSAQAGVTSVTSFVYCAKRKPVYVVHSFGSPGVATLDSTSAEANTYSPSCPRPDGKFYPGGGGFSEEGLTTSQYLIPVASFQQGGNNWHASGLKVGSGSPVTLVAHTVCG